MIDAAHLHLAINHIPVVGTLIGLFIYAHGWYHNSKPIYQTGLALFTIMALFSMVAYFSGENAEDIVESIAGRSHEAIHEHEEIAEVSLVLSLLLGSLSMGLFYLNISSAKLRSLLNWLVLIICLVTIAYFGYTAYTGGLISHPELR